MTNRIRLDAQRHAAFLAEQRKDPITKEPLRAGTEIVICANDKIAFIADNWSGECPICRNSNTLSYVPSSSLPSQFGRISPRPAPTFVIERNVPSINANQGNLIDWFSVSSHLAVNPMGFWGTIFISSVFGGIFGWFLWNVFYSTNILSGAVFNGFYAAIPVSSYLITKRKTGAFLTQVMLANTYPLLNNAYDIGLFWFSAVAGTMLSIIFARINNSRISIWMIVAACISTEIAKMLFALIVWGWSPSLDIIVSTLVAVTIAAPFSVVVAKIFQRG